MPTVSEIIRQARQIASDSNRRRRTERLRRQFEIEMFR